MPEGHTMQIHHQISDKMCDVWEGYMYFLCMIAEHGKREDGHIVFLQNKRQKQCSPNEMQVIKQHLLVTNHHC